MQPDGTEACLANNPELLDLGLVPRITTGPQIHINTRNRDQAITDLSDLLENYGMFVWLSWNDTHSLIQDEN